MYYVGGLGMGKVQTSFHRLFLQVRVAPVRTVILRSVHMDCPDFCIVHTLHCVTLQCFVIFVYLHHTRERKQHQSINIMLPSGISLQRMFSAFG